ncbi:hypothetical protein ONZ45_g13107 [Pleurotus djamor]|nr:hypothetical protein ONZ45_g13107 [Pleurotus djamor]
MILSATARVLPTPELLSEIFQFSDRQSNASNLLVNKAWSREVINVEWREVDGWSCLVALLAPLELDSDLTDFGSPPVTAAPNDERFNYYASKVRSLSLDQLYFVLFFVQDQIMQIKDHGNFVSNVKRLSCFPADSIALKLFVNPGLTSLTLGELEVTWSYTVFRDSVLPVLKEVSSSLVALKLLGDLEPEDVDDDSDDDSDIDDDRSNSALLASALRSLTTLKSLHLSSEMLSPTVSKTVSSLPNLESLICPAVPLLDRHEDREQSCALSTSLKHTSFPSLRSLSLRITFIRAIASFEGWGKSDTLTSLEITSEVFESPERFGNLAAIISDTFPRPSVSAQIQGLLVACMSPMKTFSSNIWCHCCSAPPDYVTFR